MGKQPNCVLSLNSDVKGCISVRQSWPKPYLFKTSAPNYLFTCFFNWRRWGNYFLTKLHVGIIVKKQHNTLLLTLQEWMWEIQQERPEYSAGGHECTLEERGREEKGGEGCYNREKNVSTLGQWVQMLTVCFFFCLTDKHVYLYALPSKTNNTKCWAVAVKEIQTFFAEWQEHIVITD